MRVIAYGIVAFFALSAVATGSAVTFNTVSDDNTKADGSPRFVDPDEKAKVDTDPQSGAKTMRFGESSVTYGIQMQSGSRSFPGNYGNISRGPGFGADLFDSRR
jgi:hypothetical protein